MPYTKTQRIAKKIIKENKELFNALLEFEKTKKIRTKTRLNFTIDRSIALNFKRYCKRKGYNMSSKIEKAMEEMVKEK